jgi:hypothetical protein
MIAPAIPAPAPKGRFDNGQLRRQVAEWLAARPGPHTVGEIAKDLGRSVGAVGNALTPLAGRARPPALATVTYGRQVRPITYPGAVPAQVSELRAADKCEDFTTAVNALDGALGLSRPGSTRILVIVSDGRYKGTHHAGGQRLITRLATSGCLVIWIAPSDTAHDDRRAGGHPRRPRRHQPVGRPRGHCQRPHRLTASLACLPRASRAGKGPRAHQIAARE